MSIPAVDIAMSMRYALGDMQGVNISDYELIEPINQAVHKLYSELGQRHIREVMKSSELVKAETYTLPDGFLRIHQVLGAFPSGNEQLKDYTPNDEDFRVIIPTTGRAKVKGAYRIVGRTMTMASGAYYIEYYYAPEKITKLADEIDAPESMRSWIEQVSIAMYQKDYNTVNGIIKQAEDVLAGREIPRFQNSEPVQTIGQVMAER